MQSERERDWWQVGENAAWRVFAAEPPESARNGVMMIAKLKRERERRKNANGMIEGFIID